MLLSIVKAALLIRHGSLVVMPTETVYGLGALASCADAVRRVYLLKRRPLFNPLIAHFYDFASLIPYVKMNRVALTLAQAFWPGSLTLVLPKTEFAQKTLVDFTGLDTLAVRIPSHNMARDFLYLVDEPVFAPSANISGRLSPTSVQHIDPIFFQTAHVLDGGRSKSGMESSVVYAVDDHVQYILREGAIPSEMLNSVLEQELQPPLVDHSLMSPGMLLRHYAPQSPLILNVSSVPAKGVIHIGFGDCCFSEYNLSSSGHLGEAAFCLFDVLHQVDALRPEAIAVAPIPEYGLGRAVNDRLLRASRR